MTQRQWQLMDYDVFVVTTWYQDEGGAGIVELFEGVGFLQDNLPDVDELEARAARLVDTGVLVESSGRWYVTEGAWHVVLCTRAVARPRNRRAWQRLGARLLAVQPVAGVAADG